MKNIVSLLLFSICLIPIMVQAKAPIDFKIAFGKSLPKKVAQKVNDATATDYYSTLELENRHINGLAFLHQSKFNTSRLEQLKNVRMETVFRESSLITFARERNVAPSKESISILASFQSAGNHPLTKSCTVDSWFYKTNPTLHKIRF